MRFVDRTGPGTLALNYMWLPTFIGMNSRLVQEIEAYLAPHIVGQPLDEATLDTADQLVLEFLGKRFPDVLGLPDYLDGLKFVGNNGRPAQS